jgi:UDP-glucose 4-epimerase
LLTGGAGFIGSHIADRLLARGHEVAIVDDLSSGKRENVPEDPSLAAGVLGWRPEVDFPTGLMKRVCFFGAL